MSHVSVSLDLRKTRRLLLHRPERAQRCQPINCQRSGWPRRQRALCQGQSGWPGQALSALLTNLPPATACAVLESAWPAAASALAAPLMHSLGIATPIEPSGDTSPAPVPPAEAARNAAISTELDAPRPTEAEPV